MPAYVCVHNVGEAGILGNGLDMHNRTGIVTILRHNITHMIVAIHAFQRDTYKYKDFYRYSSVNQTNSIA